MRVRHRDFPLPTQSFCFGMTWERTTVPVPGITHPIPHGNILIFSYKNVADRKPLLYEPRGMTGIRHR